MSSIPKHEKWIAWIHRTVQSPWFPIQAALVVVADFLFPLLPSTAMVSAASILAPKRWFSFGFWLSVGCGIGAYVVTALFQLIGEPILTWMLGDFQHSSYIQNLNHLLETYGLWVLLIMGIVYMPLRTLILLLALSATPIWLICVTTFIGRFIGFTSLAWLSSRAPNLLIRIPFVRRNKMLSSLLNK